MAETALWAHFIIVLRVGPIIALFPGFGESSVPVRIKLVLTLLFSVAVTPALAEQLPSFTENGPPLLVLILTETGIGTLVGLGIRILVLALQTAGSIAAQSTSLAQILGSAGVTPLPAIGHLLVYGGLALCMIMDLHVHLATTIIYTYLVLPPAIAPNSSVVAQWGVHQVSKAFALAFSLAAPFVIVSVLYNVTLGVINRAMPQMMVVFVGAPVITGTSLFMLFLLAPLMLSLWVEALEGFLIDPFKAR